MHKVFEQHPQLKQAFITSDDTAFYQETDAKNHAKTLEDKTVEPVFNEMELNVVDEEVLSSEEEEMKAFEAAETAKAEQEAIKLQAVEAEEKAKKDAEEKAVLVNEALVAFDPETTDYNAAVKLFKDLGLTSDSNKKDVIYPILAEAKAAVQIQ